MNETTKALVIYDNDGRVWGVYSGETVVPSGVQGFITDIPTTGIKGMYLDMSTTPPTPHIVPNPDMFSELSDTQLALIELDERISALEG